MASRNDESQSWVETSAVVPGRRDKVISGIAPEEVRAVVAREFSLMEKAHDRIRALQLAARLPEK